MDKDNIANNNLKKNSVGVFGIIVMSIAASAPAMCLSGSLGTIMQGAGSAVTLAYLLATLVIILVGINYGQLASRYNSAGGSYSYVRSVMGARMGFISGGIYLGVILCAGVTCSVFAVYLHELFSWIPLWAGVFLIIIPVFAISWRGVEVTTRALVLSWVVQMVLLLYPAVKIILHRTGTIGQPKINPMQPFTPGYGYSGLMLGVLVCVSAFVGFECPAFMGEELKGGSKSVKHAIIASAAAIGVIFSLTTWLWICVMQNADMEAVKNSPTTLADYAVLAGYPEGGVLISLSSVVSAVGAYFAFSTATSRCLYDMGRTNYLPKVFARVNAYQTPHVALGGYCAVCAGIALYGAYVSTGMLFTMVGLFASFSYILICVTNLIDRWDESGLFSVIINKVLPVAASLVLLYMISSTEIHCIMMGTGWIAIFCILSFRRQKHNMKNDL